MTQITPQPQEVQPVQTDPQSILLSRLKALKSDVSGDDANDSPRWIWWIVGGIAGAIVLCLFFVTVAWRLYSPSQTTLADGWVRVTDRQWAFQMDFPKWYQRNSDGRTVQYTSRLSNGQEVQVQVYDWRQRNLKPTSAQATLATIIATEQAIRPVKITADRSRDLANPMIEFVSTCGQAGGYQWKVRERALIQREVIIRIRVVRSDDAPLDEVERMLGSVQWLRQSSSSK